MGEQAGREFRLTCPCNFVLTRHSPFGIMTERSGVRIPAWARRPDLLVAGVLCQGYSGRDLMMITYLRTVPLNSFMFWTEACLRLPLLCLGSSRASGWCCQRDPTEKNFLFHSVIWRRYRSSILNAVIWRNFCQTLLYSFVWNILTLKQSILLWVPTLFHSPRI